MDITITVQMDRARVELADGLQLSGFRLHVLDAGQWVSGASEQTVGVSFPEGADLVALTSFLDSEGWSYTVNQ